MEVKSLLLQFLRSLSVWWPYIQSVINMDFINKCILVISRVCKVYVTLLLYIGYLHKPRHFSKCNISKMPQPKSLKMCSKSGRTLQLRYWIFSILYRIRALPLPSCSGKQTSIMYQKSVCIPYSSMMIIIFL